MKKSNLVILGFACLFGVVGCGSTAKTSQFEESWNTTFTKPTLTVVDTSKVSFVNEGQLTLAVSTDYAPYEFIDLTKTGKDKYVGSDICLAQALANAFQLELNIKPMDFDTTLVSLDNGTADIAISGFSYTTSRASSYLYTNCYYSEGDGGQVVIVNKKDADKYQTLADLNKSTVKVAAQNGALQIELVEKQLPNADLIKIDDLNSEYDALSAGTIDAIAIAENVANALLAKSPDDYAIVPEHFDYADSGEYALVKKGNTALVNAVNSVIEEIKTKGYYATWVSEAQTLFANLGSNAGETIPEGE